MLTKNVHRILRALGLSLLLCSVASGRRPKRRSRRPRPQVPRSKMRHRPPGTQRNQPVPEQVRPVNAGPDRASRLAASRAASASGNEHRHPQSGAPQTPALSPMPTATDSLLPEETTPDATRAADAYALSL